MRTGRVAGAWLLVAALAGGCAWTGFTDKEESLLNDGQELYEARQYDEAIAKLERAVELDDTSWLAHLYLARCYMAKKNWTLAATHARLAYQEPAAGEEAAAVLSEALLGGGVSAVHKEQFTLAITEFTEYVTLHPNDARGFLGLGQAEVGAGHYDDALTAFTRGIENDRLGAVKPDLLKGLLDGGMLALRHGEAKVAVPLLQEYVRENPTNARAYVLLAKALLETGSGAPARDALERALLLNPHEPEAAALRNRLP
jgi:Flp pilus assembly protein TadD